ncbi:ABC transporter permease [Bacillus sonorensis]|uniref:ABC transporter permease n=1 Tax=Bacillus sonorensis TaxID=119858 RepID=UPI002282ECAA|nr:ABC transporter permease [Bacillus sonorensis]MCY8027657.1 ABC transporter permease [Bacillus sonorensis]
MASFQQAFSAEWIKIRKMKIWLMIIILVALPVIYGWIIHTKIMIGKYDYNEANSWQMLLMMTQMFYGTVFFPIIISLITGTMSKYEKQANNWEHLLMIPAKGTVFFLSKMAWTVIIILSAQLLMFGLQIILGYASGYTDQIPIGTYLSAVILGTAGAISLGTLLFYFYLRMKSARTALMISIFLSFPSFLAFSNNTDSLIPVLYPWALPLYGMTNVYAGTDRLAVFFIVCVAMTAIFSLLSIKKLNNRTFYS